MNRPSHRPNPFAPGSLVGDKYEVLKEVGRGAYSTVYAGRDRISGELVALKVLTPPPKMARVATERLRREAELTQRVRHKGIVPVHDYLEIDGSSLLVLEYVPGQDLAERLRRRGPLQQIDVIHLGTEVAEALGAAHAAGIVHRDLKPENILVDQVAGARVTDFGSAWREGQSGLTDQGTLTGTLRYAAPELIAGERGDARSDIYSLGLTMYVSLVGHLPDGPSTHLPPKPLEGGFHPSRSPSGSHVSPWLDDMIAHATTANPSHRCPTMEGLAQALRRHQAGSEPLTRRIEAPDACLVCGERSILGLPVCDRCGGLADENTDAVLLVANGSQRTSESPSPVESVRQATRNLVSDHLLRQALHGHRAVARVPRAATAQILNYLDTRGLQGRVVPLTGTWQAIPASMWLILLGVTATGLAAGLTAHPRFLWATPLVATLLAWSAARSLRSPLIKSDRTGPGLDPKVEAMATSTLVDLEPGPARHLLADIVRLARRAVEEGEGPAESIETLVAGSCEAARDLSVLDDNLDRFQRQQREIQALPSGWWLGVADTETARDRLAQHLLEVTAILGRYQSYTTEALNGAAAGLSAALDEARLTLT